MTLIGICLIALSVSSAGATTYLVLPDGSGDAPTLATALALAVSGDVIELGDGVFHGPGNEGLDLGGRPLTLRSRSGNPAACVLDPVAGAAAPRRILSLVSGETAQTRIEGIGFRGAYLAGDDDAASGAAVLIAGSSPVFANCRFEGNEARQGGAIQVAGGAPTFADCVFSGNIGRTGGGALAVTGGANASLLGCEFVGNGADFGGAVLVDAAAVAMTDCILRSNAASARGGGLYGGDHAAIALDACTLAWNDAPSGGGLALVTSSTATIAASIIAFSGEGEAIDIPWPGPIATLSCSDLHGNAGGDWTDDIAAQLGTDGNIAEDPAFCGDAADGNVGLATSSPCAAAQSGCGHMGAAPVACSSRARRGISLSTLKSYY